MKKLILVLALLITTNVFAGGKHHEHETINVTEVTKVTNITYVEDDSVLAGAIGMHTFSYSTYADQKSVTAVYKEGSKAISGAIAHRDCADCGLFSIAAAVADINDETKLMIGVGYTWSY